MRNGASEKGPHLPGGDPATAAFALTPGQKSLWFMQQILPESAVYHIALAVRILSPLDVASLRSALQAIADRHDSLRTVFTMNADGELAQQVCPPGPVAFETIDARGYPENEIDDALDDAYRRPFNLAAGPLFRSHLFTRGPEEHLLLINAHHLVFDVLSLVVVFSELLELYESARSGGDVSLRAVKCQYRDFVDWQSQMLAGPAGEAHLAFWREQLHGAPPVLDFPTDHPRPLQPSGLGDAVVFRVSNELMSRLRTLAAGLEVHIYDIFAAAWHVLLHRYSGQSDIPFGFVTGGRPQLRFARTTGLFSNAIVLRARLDDDPAFATFVQRQQLLLAQGLLHQDYPFPLLVDALRVDRVPGYMPLIQVLFNYFKMPRAAQFAEFFLNGEETDSVQLDTLAMKSHGLRQNDIEFDLTMEVAEGKRCWSRIRYSTDLFDRTTIERLAQHYVNLLDSVAADASGAVSSIPLLGETERHEILFGRNRTEADYPAEITACRLFEIQAGATPDRTAVVCEDRSLTYAELNRRAESLAAFLHHAGAGMGSLVGVCVERSVDMLVALLAVWKAGAAYVPLDPHFPKARLDLIVEDAAPGIIVTEAALVHLFTAGAGTVIELDTDEARWSAAHATDVMPAASGADFACVLYTSGSTGKPKGVEIPHQAFTNFLLSMRKRPGLGESDMLLAVTTFSFDIAGLELFLPLITGACVVIATREMALDGRQLAREIELRGISVMQATPATWRLLIDSGWQGYARLKALCGGEALPAELAQKLLPLVGSLWNMYGPTETTVWSAVHETLPGDDPIPLGNPIDNTTLYILDRNLQPVPDGVAGELHIGGAGLARGYRNRPDLTADRFIGHPFIPGERLYKTGDLCRCRADGSILFLGRLDDQVKLRGHRIELGEIETVLLRHPAVHEAVVTIDEQPGGPKRLVAYLVVPAGVSATPPASLREYLSGQLPEYMIPSVFVHLDALPLTPNAKVDRKALRVRAVAAAVDEREFAAPRTPTETAIAALWEEMLKTTPVGAHHRFDELGGDSLSFALMTIRAGNRLGVKIPVRMQDEMLTVAGFARAVDRIAGEAPAAAAPISGEPTPAFRPEPLARTWHGQILLKTCTMVVRCLARIEVDGLEHMPSEGPAIVASNHISLFDFVILGCAFGHAGARRFPLTPTFVIADKWRWLAQPYASQLGNVIYIRRGLGDMDALSAAREVLSNQGGTIALMPEGRPSRGALARAKPGIAYLARETGSPVWPLAVFGHDRILYFWKRLRRVPVRVRWGQRLSLNHCDNAIDFQQHADSVMRAIAALMPPEYHGVYSADMSQAGQ